jgi:hypothetical protein
MKSIALLALIAAPFVAGCLINTSSNNSSDAQSLHSANIETNQMLASFSVQAGETNVSVYAAVFQSDSNGISTGGGIVLDPGDYFTATVAGSTPIILGSEAGVPAEYTATLPLATAAEDVTIAFVRGSGHVSAPDSVIHVPAPFTITTPAPASLRIGGTFAVHVDPPPADSTSADFDVTGDCIVDSKTNTYDLTFDAQGNAVLNATSLSISDGSSGCSASFFINVHGTGGSVDSAFATSLLSADGPSDGEQRRAFTTNVTP